MRGLRARPARGPAPGYGAQLRVLSLPYLLGMGLLVGVPVLLTFALTFFEYGALAPPRWAGPGNYAALAQNPLFWTALGNSLLFTVLAVPLRVLGALALALLLSRPRRGVGWYRAAVYLPTVLPDAAYALIWLWLANPIYGPLGALARALGLPPPSGLADAASARAVFVLMGLFQIGEGFVVLLAGLKSIPAEFYHAAAVDGASAWQALRRITLPLLAPWLLLLTCRDLILSLQYTFTPAYLMTGGGPYYATLILPLYAFQEAFDRFRFGTGSAMMLLMFAVALPAMGVLYAAFRQRGHADGL